MTQKQYIVSKFGGSSMKDVAAMRRSAEIIKREESHLIIVSATHGTTNQLLEISQSSPHSDWKSIRKKIGKIKEKHLNMAKDIEAKEECLNDLNTLFNELVTLAKGINLLKDCSLKAYDSLLALGERLSSRLFTECLSQAWPEKNISCFDARQVIITDQHFTKARPLKSELKRKCLSHLVDAKYGHRVFVTQGFIGSTQEGVTTTLGRGGSDFSAALFAWGTEASVLQIWTDVAGIASTDPRVCSSARPISEITFSEASELANFGAKVLHPETLAPAMEANIPVFVGSSYEPDLKGTWINRTTESKPLVRALAIRKNQTLLTLKNPKMLQTYGFLFDIFKIFNDSQMSVDSITTSEISVAMTINDKLEYQHPHSKNKQLIDSLQLLGDVEIEEDLCLVSLIGNNINHTPGLAAQIFTSIPEINVRMICLGASKHNFCFLVKDEDGPPAVNLLHQTFIGPA